MFEDLKVQYNKISAKGVLYLDVCVFVCVRPSKAF